ncbi:LamG-like jellyroll fold domain-containing protein [Nocardioides yefusunii]|uniref:LamG-like jellyroll fold domain-containing protein n=1 Tax=Nocardioides yefusunii TaxID=2500546 RepID=A0ABW1QTX3_9ACTN|nr:LamG-like jellyroll fold domain-containing protein [Nocardioides yefusunii]
MSPRAQDTARPGRSPTSVWAEFCAVTAARLYRAVLLTLAAAAVVPSLFGWHTYVVQSGSMEPRISVGDVVHTRSLAPEVSPEPGRIYAFADPSRSDGHVLLHRIIGFDDDGPADGPHDGTWTSQGDANPDPDITPVPREAFLGRATLMAPWVGSPVVWFRSAAWAPLLLWMVLTALAFGLARRRLADDPPGLVAAVRSLRRSPEDDDSDPPDPPHGGTGRSIALVCLTLLALAVATTVVGSVPGNADARFSRSSPHPGNKWTASSDFRHPYVRAVDLNTPAGFWLLDESSGTTTLKSRFASLGDGTVYGSTTTQPATGGAIPGAHLKFTGKAGYAVLGGAVGSLLGLSAVSVELWFRTTRTSTPQQLAGLQINATSATANAAFPSLQVDASGRIREGILTSLISPAGKAYDDGEWHHVVLTMGAGVAGFLRPLVIYVDGASVASGNSGASLEVVSAARWRIGAGGYDAATATSHQSEAHIDAVSAYGVILSASQVKTHWCAARPTASNCL